MVSIKIDKTMFFQFTPTEGAAAKLGLVSKNGEAIALSAPIG